jgi:hypothetical protein
MGPKATQGPYVWGKNGALFHDVTRLRLFAEEIWPEIGQRPTRWLLAPDPTGEAKHLAWTQADGQPSYVFVANTDGHGGVRNFNLPWPTPESRLELVLSTAMSVNDHDRVLIFGEKAYKLAYLAAGEGRVYRVVST